MSPRARRLCRWSGRTWAGAPVLAHLADPGQSLCTAHRAAEEALRGSAATRGYGGAHRAARARWAPKVARGVVSCWRCGQVITPGQRWVMGHQDDRSLPTHPEHESDCNARAAGLARHGLPWTPSEDFGQTPE